MKTISKTIYDTPKVEIVEIKAERGFAQSGFGEAGEAGPTPDFSNYGYDL